MRSTGTATNRRRPFVGTLRELGALYEDAAIVVIAEGNAYELSQDVEEQILRVAEEAVSNAIAHGHAQRVTMELQYRGGSFSIWIRDHGDGFDMALWERPHASDLEPAGLGFMGMRERACREGPKPLPSPSSKV